MLNSILTVGMQVLILLVLISVGYLCGKIRLLTDEAVRCMSAFVLKVVAPCAIIESFCRSFDQTMLGDMFRVMLIAFLAYGLAALIAFGLIRKGEKRISCVLRFGVMFGNCGYMGLPLLQVLFGADGMFYGATYIAIYNLVVWTFGLFVMSGDVKVIRLKKLINPALIGVAVGLTIFLGSIRLPNILMQPISYFSALNVPVPLVITGYHLSKTDLLGMWKHANYYVTIAIRLIGVPVLLILLLSLTKWNDTMLVSCIVSTAVPVAAVTTMFAEMFGQDTRTAANIVSISTLMSILTLPIIVAFAQTMFK